MDVRNQAHNVLTRSKIKMGDLMKRQLFAFRRRCADSAQRGMRGALGVAVAPALALLVMLTAAHAETAQNNSQTPDVNDTTVGIVTGTVTGTYIQFASDLSNVLDTPGKLRILALLGKGSMQNVEDILTIRGVDLGIVQSDVLTYVKKNGLFADGVDKLQYITKLYNEELHLLARADIQKLEDLRGKKVNFGLKGSGIAVTSSVVFDLLKIAVEPTYEDPEAALEKLKKGDIAASMGVYGKPAKIYRELKAEQGVKFLPVPPNLELSKVYFPSLLTAKDYPDLIPAGETVETIAVGAILVVYGWEPNTPRYNKVSRFVDMFFSSLAQLQQPPRHQKWQEVTLVPEVPGWVRFPAAQEWLKRASVAKTPTQSPDLAAFERFLAEEFPGHNKGGGDDQARLKLYQAFKAWRNSQAKQ